MNNSKILAAGVMLTVTVILVISSIIPSDCSQLTNILEQAVLNNQQSTDQLKAESLKAITEAKILKDQLTNQIEVLKQEKKELDEKAKLCKK